MKDWDEHLFLHLFLYRLREKLRVDPDIDKFDQLHLLLANYYERIGNAPHVTGKDVEMIYRWMECLFLESNHPEDRRQFRKIFLDSIREEGRLFREWLAGLQKEPAPVSTTSEPSEITTTPGPSQELPSGGTKDAGKPTTDETVEKGKTDETAAPESQSRYVHIRIGAQKAKLPGERPEVETQQQKLVKNFRLTQDYHPLPRRDAIQVWRALRIMEKEGQSEQIDIPETVKRLARDRILETPAFRPDHRKQARALYIFVDYRGSMAPFHRLSELLVSAALAEGGHHDAQVYYFYNVPRKQVFLRDATKTAVSLGEALASAQPSRSVALIISDAGAARGEDNPPRVEATQEFLDFLKGRVAQVAWLNPMPYDRWFGTTAERIARRVDMFPIFGADERGFSQAVQLLIGKDIRGFPG